MAEGSAKVVYAALAGNLAIAAAKFVAFAFSGSGAMLTEGIHSSVDSVNQLLLLFGQARARKPSDAAHPFGYGMEMYFWSFVVAIMVFLLGGMVSLQEGVHRLQSPHEVLRPYLNLAVLGVAAVFETMSLAVGLREYKRIVRDPRVGLWRFIRRSKDLSLVASLLEDSAALVGIAIAAAGVIGSSVWHMASADGWASIAIGLLLATMALVLSNETRSLIAGEAVAPRVSAKIRHLLEADPRVVNIIDIATLHLGPHAVLVALTLTFPTNMAMPSLRKALRDLTAQMRRADARITYVYFRSPLELER